jgi:hypothetical protein
MTMMRLYIAAAGLGAAALVLCLASFRPAAAQPATGWTMLLEGSTLDGWNRTGTANWRIVDGAAQADEGTGFLVTPASYGDFELEAEFWVDDDANSGIFIRCEDPNAITPTNAYEVNIFDKRPDQTYRTGAIVNIAAPTVTVNTGGRWNTLGITARGSRLGVTVNGTRTVDVEDDTHARGPIGLQYMAGVVKFRNVRIRPL